MKYITAVLDKISTVMGLIGTGWIFIMVFLMTGDVIFRTGLNAPLNGIPEMVACSMPLLAFMMLPESTMTQDHVRSTIFLDKYPIRVRYFVESIANLVGAALYILIVVASWEPMKTAVRVMEYEGDGSVRIPVWEIRIVIVVSSALVAAQFLRHTIVYLHKAFRKNGMPADKEGE